MITVKDLKWTVNITLTRKQIIALGKISSYIGNIEADYKKAFPSGVEDIDWNELRSAFAIFSNTQKLDLEFYKNLAQLVNTTNKEVKNKD